MKNVFESKLILGAKPAPEMLADMQRKLGVDANVLPQFMVYQVTLDNRTHYCCWSGGKIVGDDVQLTDIGLAALESLSYLPRALGETRALVFQQMVLGPTPLQEKVIATLRNAPKGARTCFFGDLAKELDGHMGPAFNVVGAIALEELVKGVAH